MNRGFTRYLFILLLIGFVWTPAPPGDAALPPRRGGTLTLGFSHPLVLADPALAATTGERQTTALVCEPLFDTNGQTVTGRLALSFREEDEGRVLRVHLKPGVRFHDGTTLRAEDVRASLARLILGGDRYPAARRLLPIRGAQAAFGKGAKATIAGIEAPSPVELLIRFESPTPGFALVLADPAFSVLPASRLNTATTRPVGTGPFVLENLSPTRANLRAFPEHHAGRPHLDRVSLVVSDSPREDRRLWDGGALDGLVYPRLDTAPPSHVSAVTGFSVLIAPNPALAPKTRQHIAALLPALVPCRSLVELFEARRIAPFPGAAPKGPTVRGPDPQLAAFSEVMRRSVGESCTGFDPDPVRAARLHAALGLSETLVIRVRRDQPELALAAQRLALLARQDGIPVEAQALDPDAFVEQRAAGGWHLEVVEAPVVSLDEPHPARPEALSLYRLMPRLDWRTEYTAGVLFTRFGVLGLADAHRRNP